MAKYINLRDQDPRVPHNRPEKGYVHHTAERTAYTEQSEVALFGDSLVHNLNLYPSVGEQLRKDIKSVNFGIGGDRTQNILHRLQNDCDLSPTIKYIFLLIGTNNLSSNATSQTIAEAILKVAKTLKTQLPSCEIIISELIPRCKDTDNYHLKQKLTSVNRHLSKLVRDSSFKLMHIFDKCIAANGHPDISLLYKDRLHLSEKGNRLLAATITQHVKMCQHNASPPPNSTKFGNGDELLDAKSCWPTTADEAVRFRAIDDVIGQSDYLPSIPPNASPLIQPTTSPLIQPATSPPIAPTTSPPIHPSNQPHHHLCSQLHYLLEQSHSFPQFTVSQNFHVYHNQNQSFITNHYH